MSMKAGVIWDTILGTRSVRTSKQARNSNEIQTSIGLDLAKLYMLVVSSYFLYHYLQINSRMDYSAKLS